MVWDTERVWTVRFLLTCNALIQSHCVESLLIVMVWDTERVWTVRSLLTCNGWDMERVWTVRSLLTCNGLGYREGADCKVLTDM